MIDINVRIDAEETITQIFDKIDIQWKKNIILKLVNKYLSKEEVIKMYRTKLYDEENGKKTEIVI